MTELLQVENLSVSFGAAKVVDDISFSVEAGEAVALVGESGSGKTLTAMSLIRLLPRGAEVQATQMKLNGLDLHHASEKTMNSVRGSKIGVLFQQPKRMLDPTSTVGRQLAEPLRMGRGMSRSGARHASLELLRDVGIPEPERRARSYAHELSGGMAQRVMIAIALAGQPELLIADEPTTALDVTVEAQILKLITSKKKELGMSLLFISHDLKVVADVADRIAVMYAGRIIELGSAAEILTEPKHPYTKALIECSLLRPSETGELYAIPGSGHSARETSYGCRFQNRCRISAELHIEQQCASDEPPLIPVLGRSPTHLCRCWAAVPDLQESA